MRKVWYKDSEELNLRYDMRLSEGSKVICDIDDVLLDNEKGMRAILEDVAGRKIGKIDSWGFDMLSEKERALAKDRVNSEELFRYTTYVEGGIEAVKRLQEDHEVYFVTSVCEKVEQLRKKQVYEMFGSTKNLIITPHKYLIKGDLMIDDGPHNIDSSICDKNIVFNRDWNAGLDLDRLREKDRSKEYVRAYTWGQIMSMLGYN